MNLTFATKAGNLPQVGLILGPSAIASSSGLSGHDAGASGARTIVNGTSSRLAGQFAISFKG